MNVRDKIGFLLLSAIIGGRFVSGAEPKSGESVLLNASDFGVVADGRTDDGPAIGRMLAAIKPGKPAVLTFSPKGIIYAKQVQNRFLFQLNQMESVELDGNGTTFILDPSIRFLDMNGSQDMTVKHLNVTFRPLPFAEGTIVAVDADKGFVDVRLQNKGASLPLGKPTGEDGEQSFFALAWSSGAYGLISEHLWVENIARGSKQDTVRIKASGEALEGGRVIAGQGISVPVPGLAHRYGVGACFEINDSSRVLFEDVELWSAPWFGIRVFRNRDWITFRRVHIRPRPGSDSTLSTWRDGFHVKGNFAKLLWEDCQLIGMGDDAFNISTHSSSITKIISPVKFEVRQRFCLQPIPWHENMHLVAADDQSKRILGEARIVGVTTRPDPAFAHLPDPAPISVVELDCPIEGLAKGIRVWEKESSNPDTTLRGCLIRQSCRLQCSVQIEHCDITGLLWFYGELIEGPYPQSVRVSDSILRIGRGNSRSGIIVSGAAESTASKEPPRAIHDIVFENNRIFGSMNIQGVERLVLRGNQYPETSKMTLKNNLDAIIEDDIQY